jgi:ribosome biogenesis GTPase / thiamine phosphate phosphatase
MDLQALGATPEVWSAFSPHAAQGLVLARVAVSQRDRYRLYAETGELDAEPSGSLWHRSPDRASMPVVGDWVAARIVGPGQAIVDAVLPRTTLFSRRAPGRREDQQPIAANVDLVFLVCGLDGDFNVRRLERYLTLAHESGAAPVVVLNKADAAEDLAALIEETASVAGAAPIVACSARTGEGLDAIAAFLGGGRTVALLGSSGVGKSTLVNRMLGEERFLTNEVRESDSRGRHTTTHRELVPLPEGGALIDTPGMRELQLWASQDSVEATFEEIAEIASGCRYRDCTHAGEKGCAVASALADGVVSEDRMESYRKLRAEAKHHEVMTDKFAALEQKRKWKVIHKAAKKLYRDRG